ncbi:MAG: DUF1294 domain-containing protein [Hylemonella sp.]|nr:DUF1294 domain-containing protein [Hylemonella sp.]
MSLVLTAALGYTLMSVLTYAVYAADKSAALRKRRRVPERTLHLLALLGGWPGALLAQQQLRHKTSKPRFLLVYWLTVVGNFAGLLAITGLR